MKDNRKPVFKKTEELLRNYKKYKLAVESDPVGTIKTQKLLNVIDGALGTIEDDPYYEIISMIFFENMTREAVAEYFDVEVKTISRNKNRLVNELKVILFSDDTIEDIFM